MSVRTMTTDALQKDLNNVMAMFGGAPPPEQQDRVNALRHELKRRGVEARVSPIQAGPDFTKAPQQEDGLAGLSDDQLQKKLFELSNTCNQNPMDEEAQAAFADVRYEVRRRAKSTNGSTNGNGNGNGYQPPQPVAVKAALPDNAAPEPERLVPRAVQVPPQADVERAVAIAERNAQAFRDLERTQMKLQQASLAAMVAGRMLSERPISEIDGDQIEHATDVGLAIAARTFEKLGLIT